MKNSVEEIYLKIQSYVTIKLRIIICIMLTTNNCINELLSLKVIQFETLVKKFRHEIVFAFRENLNEEEYKSWVDYIN